MNIHERLNYWKETAALSVLCLLLLLVLEFHDIRENVVLKWKTSEAEPKV